MIRSGFIEKLRLLPYRGNVLVKEGDRVEPWTSVAKIGYLPGKMTRVDVASQLMVEPRRISELMLKAPGDPVSAGEVIARGSLFWDERQCRASVAGIVGLVSKHLGYVYIREPIELGHTEPSVIDVAGPLGIKPFLIGEYLNVSVGKMVVKDQPIASKRMSFGGPVVHVTAPTYGVLTELDRKAGTVTVMPLFRSTDVLAYISGTVSRVLPDEGVVIRSYASVVHGVFGLGGEAYGELFVPAPGREHQLVPSDVTEACQGKIVVGGATATREAVQALATAGAKAVVLGYYPVEGMKQLAPGLNMGITGNESTPLTLIVTEGFQQRPMSFDVYNTLKQNEGRISSCNGTTHIRAGVIRPEVVIPQEQAAEDGMPAEQDAQASAMGAGSRVRLLRRPYPGETGVILSMITHRQLLESGISAPVFVVRLDSGKTVTIPRSNCVME